MAPIMDGCVAVRRVALLRTTSLACSPVWWPSPHGPWDKGVKGQINPLSPCNNSKLFGHTGIACHQPCQGLSGSRYYRTFPAALIPPLPGRGGFIIPTVGLHRGRTGVISYYVCQTLGEVRRSGTSCQELSSACKRRAIPLEVANTLSVALARGAWIGSIILCVVYQG